MNPRWIAALLVAMAVACDEAPHTLEASDINQLLESAPPPPGDPVIVVNGRSIPLGLVEEQVRAGRPKSVVVRELTEAELFYDRALSMNYGSDDAVQEEYKRIMIKRLLQKEVEDTNPPSGIASGRVKAYYDENLSLYYTPALRAADHLLVKPTSARWDPSTNWDTVPPKVFDDAAAWGTRIHADIAARGETPSKAADLEAVAARWKAQLPAELEIVVETLPASPKRPFGTPGSDGYINAMVPEFADGMFAAGDVGSLSPPVKTLFGTHLLVVTQIVPEERVTLADADQGIREFLATKDRRIASRALLTRLLQNTQVRADDARLGKLGVQPAP